MRRRYLLDTGIARDYQCSKSTCRSAPLLGPSRTALWSRRIRICRRLQESSSRTGQPNDNPAVEPASEPLPDLSYNEAVDWYVVGPDAAPPEKQATTTWKRRTVEACSRYDGRCSPRSGVKHT